MPCFTSVAVSGKGYGDKIRVYWTNLTRGGSTILSSTSYLKNGYAVVWDPTQNDESGNTGLVVTRPETNLLGLFAGCIVDLPDTVTGQKADWITILPWSTTPISLWTKADCSAAATTEVPLCISNGTFEFGANVALTADGAGQKKVRQYVATAYVNGTDTSSTAGYNTCVLHGSKPS